MNLQEIYKWSKSLIETGSDPLTPVVVGDQHLSLTLASDIRGIQKGEINFSSGMGQFIVNTTGAEKPNSKEALVICIK